MVLTQRVSTASTQPRTGQTPSKATLAKLSTATYQYGRTLRQGGDCIAPDGEPCGNYSQGWRFLPPATPEQQEILKKIPSVVEALRNLHNTPQGVIGKCGNRGQPSCEEALANYKARQQLIVNNAHHDLVIAPQIKAQEEAIARKEEEERLAIATLRMRVIELEKRPSPTPTAPATTKSPTSYLPLAVVGIVIVVILLFLRRRA